MIAVRAAAAVALLATALSASLATARPRAHPGPFVTAAMTSFLRTRAGNITAAVYNEGSASCWSRRIWSRAVVRYRPQIPAGSSTVWVIPARALNAPIAGLPTASFQSS